jgi:4-hydroxy-tetrahydrodipicolinate synthase
MEFKGTYTALITPFQGGELDLDAYRGLLRAQREAGITGVVPCGCTGEAATLSESERRQLLDIALDEVGDTMQVIAGTGTNATASTIQATRAAQDAGAHAAMLITPYYNKPSQQGLYEHYKRIGNETTLPLVLYNVPGRTAVTLAPATIARLYETGRYPALKEAAGDLEAVSDIHSITDITILSGDDSLTLAMMAHGAAGVISVVSNVLPEPVVAMVEAALAGDFAGARATHYRLLPVMRAAFVESNPSPVKAMLAERGLARNELRPPLAPVTTRSLEVVREALTAFEEARA